VVRPLLLLLLLATTPACLVDRSVLVATQPTRDDAAAADGGTGDLDAFVEGIDATLADDAWSMADTGCNAERCNAQDDDCDGAVDELAACDRGIGTGTVECESTVYEASVYQLCKSSLGVAYEEAESACFRGTGYDLLRIDSYEEGSMVARRLGGDAWIGLTDRETESRFVWGRDGHEDTLGNWAPSEPDSKNGGGDRVQNCVVLRSTALWADLACGSAGAVGTSAVTYFVCEAPLAR
jgi:hypothetical protein